MTIFPWILVVSLLWSIWTCGIGTVSIIIKLDSFRQRKGLDWIDQLYNYIKAKRILSGIETSERIKGFTCAYDNSICVHVLYIFHWYIESGGLRVMLTHGKCIHDIYNIMDHKYAAIMPSKYVDHRLLHHKLESFGVWTLVGGKNGRGISVVQRQVPWNLAALIYRIFPCEDGIYI